MRRALDLAREGWGQTAPNPMVGAVVVKGERVVGEGFHARFGEDHAEVAALKRAGNAAQGATLYVSLEPCRHHGKTPPCVNAILDSGVHRVVFAAPDPTAAGGGAQILRDMTLDVDSGVLEAEARELNAPFFHSATSDLPWCTLKLAVSMETAIASARGSATWITSAESRAEVHRMRANSDGIAVGVGTIIADDPRLTVRDVAAPRKPPARVVFDRKLRTPLSAKVVQTARETPTIIVCADVTLPLAPLFRDRGVHVIQAQDLRDAFRRLRAAGIQHLLVEGGATLASAVLSKRFAHRLVIFQAPVSLGADALHAFEGANDELLRSLEHFPVREQRTLGPDLMTIYAISDS